VADTSEAGDRGRSAGPVAGGTGDDERGQPPAVVAGSARLRSRWLTDTGRP
jgi:hypothetical protein